MLFSWLLLLASFAYIPRVIGRSTDRNTYFGPALINNSYTVKTAKTAYHCTDEAICRCRRSDDNVLVADCSYLKLKTIPKLHPDVSVIYLQGNGIRSVSGEGIPNTITYLDMSDNMLDSFVDVPFKAMNQLKHLDLSNNTLQYSNSVYSDNIFQGLTHLVHLNIKQNDMKYILRDLHFPVSISKLKTLEELLLDGVDLLGFEAGFLQLNKLTKLDLSGQTGICHLGILRSDFFENVSSVENLDISSCNIHKIDMETLRGLTNLHSLNISSNECLTFRVLANVTNDMQYTSIRCLDISRIHCTFGPGTVLQKIDILHMDKTNLTHIYIASNRLAMLEIGVARKLPKTLEFISIVDNKLSFGLYDIELMSLLPNIEIIHAENQGKPHNLESGSSDCNDWRAPPSSNDRISFHTTDLLNCNRNPLSQLYHSSNTITKFPLPFSLREIYYSNNAMNFEIGPMDFRDNNITSIDLSNNLFHSWRGPLLNLQHLKYADMSNNFCSYISEDFVMTANNLETLLVQNNLLGLALYKDFKGDIFRNLKSLKILDLSTNHISTLPTVLLKNQCQLQILNLSNNALVEFGLGVSQMKDLKYLDLTNNQLRTIKPNQRDQIDSLRGNNLTINLNGNRMYCSCEELEFLKWLGRNKDIFEHFPKYKCAFTNRTEISFSDFDITLLEITKSCDSYIGIIVVLSSMVLLSFTLTISGIVYRYRWKLRYLFYMAKTRYKGYTPIANAEQDDEYTYDAFISYCSEDAQFVRKYVLINLEDTHGLRLCLHQRDFIPGREIAQNITNAIHQSRKTVVIMSRSYLDSYWGMYEFNMARMESIYSRGGDSVLLLVFYEDIPARELPLNLMDLIESKSYIEYSHDDVHGQVVFWDKLVSSVAVYATSTV